MNARTETELKAGVKSLCSPDFIKDMILTLIAAVMTGICGGVLLIFLVFSWGEVQAEPVENQHAQLRLTSLAVDKTRACPQDALFQGYMDFCSTALSGRSRTAGPCLPDRGKSLAL